MNASSRWREIEQVVITALDLPAEERDRYVDSACGADPALLSEVRALILAHEQAGDFLDPVTYRDKWTDIEDNTGALHGKAAGSYRLIRILGRGGMGVVYLGRRDDEQFEKEVAVKLMNPALYRPSMIRRFRDERQILASLEHPNIARLLDAGLTPDGIPFIVMEYVAGEPIHEFCRTRGLPVRDRLALFLKVCEAVHFAHRNLIIHRDLKPSNILVTSSGAPKLLDFGIAKMLSVTSAETTLLTTPLTQALTPDYASPEQIRGGNLTTASDVYSLGLLLYELLAGQRPYVLSGKAIDEVLHAVCEQEPQRLSSAAAQKSARLAHELSGDLDAIVAKALRKEATERYSSVEHLASDIERYLGGFPVEARRGSLRYAAGKYLRRYKVAFAAGAIALLLACASVAAIVQQARIAERRFNQVRQLARSVIFELHDGIAPLAGSLEVRKLLVTRALEFLNTLAREAHNDRGLTLELVEAFLRIGEVQGGLSSGSLGESRSALASFLKARDLLVPLYQADRPDTTIALLMGRVYYRLSGVSATLRDFPKAIEYSTRAQETYSRLLLADPANDASMRGLAHAYFAHAVTLGMMGGDGLSDYWQKTLDIYKTLLARGSREPGLEQDYSRSLTFYGSRLEKAGRLHEALDAIRRSEAINEKRLSANPGNLGVLADLSNSYSVIADVLNKLGRPQDALTSVRKELALLQNLSAGSPQDVTLRDRLARSHLATGEQLLQMSHAHDALAGFRQAIRIHEDLAARRPPVSFSRRYLAQSWLSAGKLEEQLGRVSAACEAYRHSAHVWADLRQEFKGEVPGNLRDVGAEAAKAASLCPP
ncbi:MAG: protein kinase domain-containing protein [Bryobacteraceae bacterium]